MNNITDNSKYYQEIPQIDGVIFYIFICIHIFRYMLIVIYLCDPGSLAPNKHISENLLQEFLGKHLEIKSCPPITDI